MEPSTPYRHIVTDANILSGEPTIEGTQIPVRTIVAAWHTGVSPENIPARFPPLTLAQVFAALSYYCDNRAEIDEYIDRDRTADEANDDNINTLSDVEQGKTNFVERVDDALSDETDKERADRLRDRAAMAAGVDREESIDFPATEDLFPATENNTTDLDSSSLPSSIST